MLGTIWQIYCSLNLQLVFVFRIQIRHRICTKQVIRGQNQWHKYLSKVCLKKGGTDRRMKVHDELLYVGGFTDEEIVKFGKIITTNCHKTDYFFHIRGTFQEVVYVHLVSKEALCKALHIFENQHYFFFRLSLPSLF